jgi:hypothetical protein
MYQHYQRRPASTDNDRRRGALPLGLLGTNLPAVGTDLWTPRKIPRKLFPTVTKLLKKLNVASAWMNFSRCPYVIGMAERLIKVEQRAALCQKAHRW